MSLWKITCPEGHTYGSIQIKPREPQWKYYCESCDKHYRRLYNQKTDSLVDPAQ